MRAAVAATMAAVLVVACGGVEPPPAVDGAIVGKVLVQGDTTLEFVGGPDPVVDTQVVVVGVDDLREWWEASPAGADDEYVRERVLHGEFATSAKAIEQVGGWRADVDGRGAFSIEVSDGELLLCHTHGVGDDPIHLAACHEMTMQGQARVIVWTGAAYELDVF